MTGTPVSPRAFRRDFLLLLGALAFAGQWLFLCATGWRHDLPLVWTTALPGLAIFGSAALLSWGAELAELEITQSLALAFLALVAVLPEYAVDMYLAWTAAKDPTYTAYAAANMTGANRLLIGLGWPAVLFAWWLRGRHRVIALHPAQRLELVTLLLATLYAFVIPLKRTLSLVDTVVFVTLFAWYIRRASLVHRETAVGLAGPAERLTVLPRTWRRLVTAGLFLLPAVAIFLAAEPFADGLLHSARHLGIEEFILIQWLAPFASEAPEFVVAIIFALRSRPTQGLGVLVSSKVNQWTLLIGMLPLVFAISGAHAEPMVLDARQAEEIFLTAAQSLLALVILANLRFGFWEAVILCGLFLLQFVFPTTAIRTLLAVGYLVIASGYLVGASHRAALGELLRTAWR